MNLGLIYLSIFILSSGSIINHVCVCVDGNAFCSADLHTSDMKTISIAGTQSQTDFQVQFCHPSPAMQYISLSQTPFSSLDIQSTL